MEKLYFNVHSLVSCNKVEVENDELYKSQLKVFGLKENHDFNKDTSTNEQRKELLDLGKDERVIVRKADKSNVFVIMDRKMYCQQMKAPISGEPKLEKNNPKPCSFSKTNSQ